GEIDLEHLPEAIVGASPESATDSRIQPLSVAMKAFEKRHVTRALHLANGDCETAAELLGISVKTLKQKIERHGIRVPAPQPPAEEAREADRRVEPHGAEAREGEEA